MVWNTYFYWIHGYSLKAEAIMEQQRQAYPTRYREIAWLHEEVCAIERKKKGDLNETEWSDFLKDEKEG
jgi:hypothetical protein